VPKNAARKTAHELWKDRLGRSAVAGLAAEIARVYPKFDHQGFVKTVATREYLTLELKDRSKAIATGLKPFLPDNYRKAVDILIKTAPSVGAFENWSLTAYIELFGLERFEESMRAMKALTVFSTCEFCIRPFMIRYTDRMMPILHEWATDKNEHVRRLAAEGSRPRGVWVAHIDAFRKDPAPVLELLEKLKADESLYVRKAVANNLNDISKDHPDRVIATALRWKKDNHKHTDWIIRHACRSLIKKGDPRVFPIFGFASNPKVRCSPIRPSSKSAAIGGELRFAFALESTGTKNQKLAIDYRVHYVKASGKTSPKVFKLAERTIAPGETIDLTINQAFADLSTRRHFPGEHRLEVIVNGRILAGTRFRLTAE